MENEDVCIAVTMNQQDIQNTKEEDVNNLEDIDSGDDMSLQSLCASEDIATIEEHDVDSLCSANQALESNNPNTLSPQDPSASDTIVLVSDNEDGYQTFQVLDDLIPYEEPTPGADNLRTDNTPSPVNCDKGNKTPKADLKRKTPTADFKYGMASKHLLMHYPNKKKQSAIIRSSSRSFTSGESYSKFFKGKGVGKTSGAKMPGYAIKPSSESRRSTSIERSPRQIENISHSNTEAVRINQYIHSERSPYPNPSNISANASTPFRDEISATLQIIEGCLRSITDRKLLITVRHHLHYLCYLAEMGVYDTVATSSPAVLTAMMAADPQLMTPHPFNAGIPTAPGLPTTSDSNADPLRSPSAAPIPEPASSNTSVSPAHPNDTPRSASPV